MSRKMGMEELGETCEEANNRNLINESNVISGNAEVHQISG